MSVKQKELLLILVSLFFSFVLVEGALRVVYRLNYDSFMPYGIREESQDRATLLKLAPNFEGMNRKTGTLYKTNAQGFRSDPINPNAGHVIFLGDSATFGLSLNHEDTYAALTENLLNKSCGNIQAVNTGSPGQGTFDEHDILKTVLQQKDLYHVKAVVLGFIHNDISDNFAYAEQKRTEQLGLTAKQRLVLFLKRSRAMLYVREFYHFLRDGGDTSRSKEPGREVEYDKITDEDILKNKSFRLTIEAIDKIEELCKQAGVPFVFMYMPADDKEIMARKGARYKTLLEKHFASHPGIIYFDALAAYSKYLASIGNPATLPREFYSYGADATHPGKLGTKLISEGLAPLLKTALKCGQK